MHQPGNLLFTVPTAFPLLNRRSPPLHSQSEPIARGRLQDYDISFLVTHVHCEEMYKHKLVDFIITFMEVRVATRPHRASAISLCRRCDSSHLVMGRPGKLL